MTLSAYVTIWLIITVSLTLEYLALNLGLEKYSTLNFARSLGVLPNDFNLSPEPGRPLSLTLGWLGIGTMLLTNLYILRKRMGFMQSWGSLPNWLDFHIFCGLVGPTFILFHSNFKVRGLVAVSFWSMWVSFFSGVIGRYFYIQLLGAKSDWEEMSEKWWGKFKKVTLPLANNNEEKLLELRAGALQYAGVVDASVGAGILMTLIRNIRGDIRLFFSPPKSLSNAPEMSRLLLGAYAVTKRRALTLDVYQKLMGYWHTFHLPFAFFMYAAAVVHIITALLLGVKT